VVQDIVDGSISQLFMIYEKVLAILSSKMEVLFFKLDEDPKSGQ
jgi:hypothetical protein